MQRLVNLTRNAEEVKIMNTKGKGSITRSVAPGKSIVLTDDEYDRSEDLDPDIWLIIDGVEKKCKKAEKNKKNKKRHKPHKKHHKHHHDCDPDDNIDAVLVDIYSNCFKIGIEGVVETPVEVTPGTYTRVELAAVINASMQAAYVGDNAYGTVCPYVCSFDSATSKFTFALDLTITPDMFLTLDFKVPNSLYSKVGFAISAKMLGYTLNSDVNPGMGMGMGGGLGGPGYVAIDQTGLNQFTSYTGIPVGLATAANVTVTSANNRFYLRYQGTSAEILVAAGTYTRANLATAINTAVNNAAVVPTAWTPLSTTMGFQYDTTTTQYRVKMDGGAVFHIDVENSIGDLIGFNFVNAHYGEFDNNGASSGGVIMGAPVNNGTPEYLNIVSVPEGSSGMIFNLGVGNFDTSENTIFSAIVYSGVYSNAGLADAINGFLGEMDNAGSNLNGHLFGDLIVASYNATTKAYTLACTQAAIDLGYTLYVDFASFDMELPVMLGFSAQVYTGATSYVGNAVVRPYDVLTVNQLFVDPQLKVPVMYDGEDVVDAKGYII